MFFLLWDDGFVGMFLMRGRICGTLAGDSLTGSSSREIRNKTYGDYTLFFSTKNQQVAGFWPFRGVVACFVTLVANMPRGNVTLVT